MKLKEIDIQPKLHKFISNPAVIYKTASGRRLQILSPGTINKFEGPDFSDISILLDGLVFVGDAEFHFKSSDWKKHGHSTDSNYDKVILHIVVENDISLTHNADTLVLDKSQFEEINKLEFGSIKSLDISSLEEVQHFALIRLLRKSSDSQKAINKTKSLEEALREVIANFIEHYQAKRRRPVYTTTNLQNILDSVSKSQSYQFLNFIQSGKEISLPDYLQQLMKTKVSDEGANLRREIIMNCIIPLAICLADEKNRINLFYWFWSTPALNQYGILKKKFPEIPQNFIWQQQGLLEFMKEHGSRKNTLADAISAYGFGEVLSFYRVGKHPVDQISTISE